MPTIQKSCTFCKKTLTVSKKLISANGHSICNECIESFSDLLKKNINGNTNLSKKDTKKINIKQLNSLKIREMLDQYVIGQDDAKMSVCVSVVNHYKRLHFAEERNVEVNKSNLFITGPSGSGKSLLMNTVAKFLNVPFVSVDATTLTEAGYIGQNVDTIISRLVQAAEGDLDAAENGIIFIDEVDKIASGKNRGSSTETKVSGVQNALLKMIEGSKVQIPMPHGMMMAQNEREIDTSNILFVVGGAFVGLNEIVANRLKKKASFGFVKNATISSDIASEYISDDFIEYGLIPEFVGRFSMMTHTKELTEEELKLVLTKSKQNLLSEYKFYFNVDNIDLQFTNDFITHVAHIAKSEKTGVRGLRKVCDQILLPHLYLLPEYQKRNVSKLTFDEECIKSKKIPALEIGVSKKISKNI
jgi:ATP-dependent Clp protease ATP-binding subunit ClpX